MHTPIGANGEKTAIEDLFDEKTLSIKVDGKTFNKGKKIDPSTEYGKIVFAKKVVNEHQNEINFDGFKVVLTRFELAIDEHKNNYK
ncbi:MAG: hypothetical protein H7Y42_11025 [Chitinophagaceae bacterium]|nr:hypothetical protein [Chitinophagaceae bacterium]